MLQTGTEIGGIRLERLLGRGAMGEVYRGLQLSLKRPVAVKRIADHLVDEPEAIQRFEREAQVVARLQSVHVVQVFDFVRARGPDGKDHCLIVMELIEGGASLRDVLRARGPLAWQQAASLALQAAEGLAAAAEFGVIHRDVKPDNIMLTRKGVAKLADFGLARAMDSSAMTQEGALLGTPNYIAPEGCRGEQVDHRADLYSLGATWYHLATGEPPFRGDNLMALLRHHLETAPPDVRVLAPETPVQIATLIEACLAKAPTARPASAQALAERLQALAAEGLIVPRRVPELVPIAAPGDAGEGSTARTELAAAETITADDRGETAATALAGDRATAATVVAGPAAEADAATAATALAGGEATLTAVGDGAATAATAVAEREAMLTADGRQPAPATVPADPPPPAQPVAATPAAGLPWRSLLLVLALVLGAVAGAAVLFTRSDGGDPAAGTVAAGDADAADPGATSGSVPATPPATTDEPDDEPVETVDRDPPPVRTPVLVEATPEAVGTDDQALAAAAPAAPADAAPPVAARTAPTVPAESTDAAPVVATGPEPTPTAPGAAPAETAAAVEALVDDLATAVDAVAADAAAAANATPADQAPASVAAAPEPTPPAATPAATPTDPAPAPAQPAPVRQQPAEDPDIATLASVRQAIDAGDLGAARLWLEQLSPDHPERTQLERAVADGALRGPRLLAETRSAISTGHWGRAERLLDLVRQHEREYLLGELATAKAEIARGSSRQATALNEVEGLIERGQWIEARTALGEIGTDLDTVTAANRERRAALAGRLRLEAGQFVDALLPRIDAALDAGETVTARDLLNQAQAAALAADRFDEIKQRRARL